MKFFLLTVAILASIATVEGQPAAPTHVRAFTKGAVVPGEASTTVTMAIQFGTADANVKAITATFGGDFEGPEGATSSTNWELWGTGEACDDNPEAATWTTIATDEAAAKYVTGALGAMTFNDSATAGKVVVTTTSNTLANGKCFAIAMKKGKLKNCIAQTANKIQLSAAADMSTTNGADTASTAKDYDQSGGPCKRCDDVKTADIPTSAKEIAAEAYCFCGEGLSTDTNRKICGHATNKQTCKRANADSADAFHADDKYTCADVATPSGSHSVTFTITACLSMLTLRKLL